MSRNILNLWDVDRFLRGIDVPEDETAIRRWIDRVARRWILNRYPAVGKVLRVDRDAGAEEGRYAIAWRDGADSSGITPRQGPVPSWVEAALPEGVYWLDLDGGSGQELALRLHAVALYFQSLKDSPKYARLSRVSLPDAVEAAHRFRMTAAERQGGLPDNTLLTFGDGYRFALLTSALELATEGKRMRHCVGGYRQAVSRDIVSLRDANDRPHVTIEISGSRKVVEIKGKANGPVAPRYRRYVAIFIRDLGLKVVRDRENAGITFRPFDIGNPYGWPAHEALRGMIQREMDGKLRNRERSELANFYADAKTALPDACDDTWNWFVTLFRDEDGRLLRLDSLKEYEIGGERFEVMRVRFPDRLDGLLRDSGGRRDVLLRRRLIGGLERTLLAFCRRDDRRLISLLSFNALIQIELRRLRHEHQQRVAHRLAAARREMRRRAFATRSPYEALERWEVARRSFTRLLQDEAEAHL